MKIMLCGERLLLLFFNHEKKKKNHDFLLSSQPNIECLGFEWLPKGEDGK